MAPAHWSESKPARPKTAPHNTMRVCSVCVSLALGFGGFAQEVSLTNRVLSTRRWTGVVKEKVLCRALPLHHICSALSPVLRRGGILSSLTDVAGEHFLPAT